MSDSFKHLLLLAGCIAWRHSTCDGLRHNMHPLVEGLDLTMSTRLKAASIAKAMPAAPAAHKCFLI